MKPAVSRDSWQQPLATAVRAFRLGMEGDGCEQLTRFIDQVMPVLGSLPPQPIADLNSVLGALLQGQARKDFLLVADLLEYEVGPLLEQHLC